MPLERLLFASIHAYVDPSNGASTASRDLLELLAERGVDCRTLSMGILDYRQETPLGPLLDVLDVPVERCEADMSVGNTAEVYDLTLGGVRCMMLPTVSSRFGLNSPTKSEAASFLDLADQILKLFRPQVLLTYGGHPASLELMRRARRSGTAVVFHLHNLAYDNRSAFADADAVLVPTEYSRMHYRRAIGLDSEMIPYLVHPGRVVAEDREPKYLTFVNPLPEKGLVVFARIAAELGRRRPDIPILVVEGRGTTDWLSKVDVDLSGVANLHRMANTTDPRDFYRVTRAILMPSLWQETFGLVAAEALANGIPVLASDRGALPNTLGEAGFVFTVPERCTPMGGAVPTSREVAPWVATVERLWDDPAWEAAHRARALAEAASWSPDRLAERYLDFFGGLVNRRR